MGQPGTGPATLRMRMYVVDYMSRDCDVNTCIAKHKLGDQQALSLQDYIETSLMLQYNKH